MSGSGALGEALVGVQSTSADEHISLPHAQAAWRGHTARVEAKRLRRDRAATRLQATWRMHRQHSAYQLQRR